jgi:hypothetical protein
MNSVREIIAIWPSATVLAVAIGTNPDAVRQWRKRRSIPHRYWTDIAREARKLGFKLCSDDIGEAVSADGRAKDVERKAA